MPCGYPQKRINNYYCANRLALFAFFDLAHFQVFVRQMGAYSIWTACLMFCIINTWKTTETSVCQRTFPIYFQMKWHSRYIGIDGIYIFWRIARVKIFKKNHHRIRWWNLSKIIKIYGIILHRNFLVFWEQRVLFWEISFSWYMPVAFLSDDYIRHLPDFLLQESNFWRFDTILVWAVLLCTWSQIS